MLVRYDSPLGPLSLTLDGETVTNLTFSDIDTFGIPDNSVSRWLDIYFSGRKPDFIPPIKLHGTDFQQRVWHELLKIPYGETTTYGELARRIDCRSAQAVGQAVGHNPIAIIVPCHRVIGRDGTLTGYAYGLKKKQFLLQLEHQQ